ncbi:MAG TPA: ABC-2 family transporter protein [bacterium]|nr:ABC-2 family transporter protein [bacterium]
MNFRSLQPPLTAGQMLESYGSLFVRSLKASFAYRASTVTSLLTAMLMYAIPMLVWKQVFAQNPALAASHTRMFPYLLMAGCVNYGLSMSVEFRIGQRIRQGLIATDLLKPVDFQMAQGVQAISDGLFNGVLGMVVFGCGWIFLGDEILPAGGEALAFFIPSFLMAFLIQYLICFVFVQGAFYTYSGYGIFAARGALHQTFSGISAPLTLYPAFLYNIGQWLPFRHTLYTPVSLYLGTTRGAEAWALLGEQVAWTAGLFLLGRFLMGRSLKQLEVQGG